MHSPAAAATPATASLTIRREPAAQVHRVRLEVLVALLKVRQSRVLDLRTCAGRRRQGSETRHRRSGVLSGVMM